MSDGWYESIAAIGGLTVVGVVALVKGDHEVAFAAGAALGMYLTAKGVSLARQSPPSPPSPPS